MFIVGILDSTGKEVVHYSYDAWGNVKTEKLDESHAAIAELNPFRYRSYYLDIETDLYYLQTRYYDPEVGRFISQDDVSYLDPEHINGLNLFAYCGNNPVMNVDYNGTFALTTFIIGSLIAIVATTLIGATVGGVTAAIHGDNIWKGIGNGAVIGAMVGFSGVLIASGIGTPLAGGIWGSVLVGAGGGFIICAWI